MSFINEKYYANKHKEVERSLLKWGAAGFLLMFIALFSGSWRMLEGSVVLMVVTTVILILGFFSYDPFKL